MRQAGLRGRKPVKAPTDRFRLQYLSDYLKSPLPAPEYPIHVDGGIVDWHMLGNGPDPTLTANGAQPCGDCTFAAREHLRMAKAKALGVTETWETSNSLVTEYLEYDHNLDVGANISDVLFYWWQERRILGFAPVDYTSKPQCDSIMAAFHGLYVGVNLTDNADDLFSNDEPWRISKGQAPDPNEGHCIVKVRTDGVDWDAWVTWGAMQHSTAAWTEACVEEAWAIITTEDQADLVDMVTLRADIKALAGRD